MYLTEAVSEPVFKIISESARELGLDAYVIGGYVRDYILNRRSKDVDIVATGSGIELALLVNEKTANKGEIIVYKNFGTAMLKTGEWTIEFVGARKESYRQNSRKPIVEDGTLEDDQNRRDFTVNALSISLNPSSFGLLIDPFNGTDDLKNKILKTPLAPDITFSDDPLRMMRAVRFASQLDFRIHDECLKSITDNCKRLSIVSSERITDEFNKIMMSDKPSTGLLMMFKTGLLEMVLPEICNLSGVEVVEGQGHKDNFHHTLQVLDKVAIVSDNLWLRWAALMHDVAKPHTKKFEKGTGWTFHGHEFKGAKLLPSIFRRLRLPLDDKLAYVQKLVKLHLRPSALWEDSVTDSAVRRLLFEAGNDIDDLMTLCEADITSKDPVKVRRFLDRFTEVREKLREIEEKDKLRNWQPPISGEIIMRTFNIGPSREVGIIKTAIREAILDGIINNDYDEAYGFMLKEAKKMGLSPCKQ